MIKKDKKQSLAEQISGILNTAPDIYDPEDDNLDDTNAKVAEDILEETYDDDEELLSKFRKQNIDLLADIDEKYAGKKASRKKLQEFVSVEEEDSQSDVNSENEDAEEINESDNQISEDEQEEGDDEEMDDKEEQDNDSVDKFDSEGENLTDFKHIKETDTSFQVKKGICVRNQMSIWENLLEMRIQLQKCLITANKMPQQQTFAELKKLSPEFSSKVVETRNNVDVVLDKLLLLQTLVLKNYPETKRLLKNSEKIANDGEEIPSDIEDESAEETYEGRSDSVPKKRRKLTDYENCITEHHEKYKSYRNSIIQKWHEKTRITVMKNNTNTRSIINHIEHVLSDKSKLLKRTQLKRSDYKILGQSDEENEAINEMKSDEYNTEIFDDDDFYHQLLRELIEVKSADLTDPIQLGRQWIQLQNLRSKMKKKVDTRATKGRKIRYTVNTKLVNFMAPIDESTWTEESKTELYNSLFGKNQYVDTA